MYYTDKTRWSFENTRKMWKTRAAGRKCGQMVQKFPGIPGNAKGITFLPKTFHRNEPCHLNSNGKRSLSFIPFYKKSRNLF